MRIALVAPDSRGWIPGETRETDRVRQLAERFGERGHNVVVFCTQFWDGYDERRREGGVTYQAVTVAPARTAFTARLPALIARFSPGVVHIRPEPPGTVLAASAGASVARCPLVVEWTGREPLDDTWTRRQAVRVPDRLLVPSALVGTRLRELGADEDGIERLPWSIDVERLLGTEPADGADVVYAGPLDDDANLDDLLLALAELRTLEWSALVVGDGPRRAAYEQQAADLRVDDRVTFTGDLTREERIARYRASHVFVQTRTHEPFALELLWAMACGCVGLVEYQTDSSAHELVTGHPRGFRVTDPEGIDEALREAAAYSEWTSDESFEAYDHEAVVDRYLAAYEAAGNG